jgi:hypothetical protein
MKKSVLCAAAFTMLFGFAVVGGAMAEDKGPAEMTFGSKKIAVFPHAKHQASDKVTCDDCHKGLDVKQMSTKDYAHKVGCKECHKTKGTSTKCDTCHPKKKKAIEGC